MSLKDKINKMERIEHLEDIVLTLKEWIGGPIDDKIKQEIGTMHNIEQRDKWINFIKGNIEAIRNEATDTNKLYISEIIEKEKPEFKSNNLIIAPVGSGKSTLIEKILLKNEIGKILMLVSNTALKNSICSDDNEIRRQEGKRMFTSQNKSKFGDVPYEIHIMSYAEFGARIIYSNEFVKNIKQIYCDEIHSLPNYQQFSKSAELAAAIKYLFSKHENQKIYYFTATREYIDTLARTHPEIMRNVTIFDYLKHPDIKQYMALSEYKINHVEQIRPHLQARLKSFNYFGYKCLAFNKTIAGMKKIESIAIEEGFKPISLWSINNLNEELQMNEEQLRVREILVREGYLPEPYNFLIINSAMQEGWNLYDDKIKLAIMNTVNETDKIQALGRYRNDIDILIYRIKKEENEDAKIILNDKWLNVPLNTEMKQKLCQELNIVDSKGQLRKWPSVSKLLQSKGYAIQNKILREKGRRLTTSIIDDKKENI